MTTPVDLPTAATETWLHVPACRAYAGGMTEGADELIDERAAAIARAIAEAIGPERIILFGSRARGDARADSDYDVAVETNSAVGDPDALAYRLEEFARAATPDTDVDVFVCGPRDLESRGRDPGYLEWDIVREGVLLYPRSGESRTIDDRRKTPDRLREEPPASVADWIARAEEDRRDVENNLATGTAASWTAVCFHSQQYAEKYLKALVIRGAQRPARTHVLTTLVSQARSAGYALPPLEAACAELQGYAVLVRYPIRVAIPDEAKGRRAWAAAMEIVASVERALTR